MKPVVKMTNGLRDKQQDKPILNEREAWELMRLDQRNAWDLLHRKKYQELERLFAEGKMSRAVTDNSFRYEFCKELIKYNQDNLFFQLLSQFSFTTDDKSLLLSKALKDSMAYFAKKLLESGAKVTASTTVGITSSVKRADDRSRTFGTVYISALQRAFDLQDEKLLILMIQHHQNIDKEPEDLILRIIRWSTGVEAQHVRLGRPKYKHHDSVLEALLNKIPKLLNKTDETGSSIEDRLPALIQKDPGSSRDREAPIVHVVFRHLLRTGNQAKLHTLFGDDYLNRRDYIGNNYVMCLCEHGLLDVLKQFAPKPEHLRVRNNKQDSPVSLAIRKGHLDVLKWLVDEQGCSLDGDVVVMATWVEVLKWLVEVKQKPIEQYLGDATKLFNLALEIGQLDVGIYCFTTHFARLCQQGKYAAAFNWAFDCYQSSNNSGRFPHILPRDLHSEILDSLEKALVEFITQDPENNSSPAKEAFSRYKKLAIALRGDTRGTISVWPVMQHLGLFKEVAVECKSLLNSGATEKDPELKNQVYQQIADLIWLGKLESAQEGSPFEEGLVFTTLTEDAKTTPQELREQVLLARAIQAFKYVIDNKAEGAIRLKAKFISVLEGNYDLKSESDGGKLWTEQARQLFNAYYLHTDKPEIHELKHQQYQLLEESHKEKNAENSQLKAERTQLKDENAQLKAELLRLKASNTGPQSAKDVHSRSDSPVASPRASESSDTEEEDTELTAGQIVAEMNAQ